MITKVYGIYGYTQAKIQVPVGNSGAFLSLEFRGGNPLAGAYYRPATYVTCDPTEQLMIEESKMFGSQIVIFSQYGEAEPQPAKVEKPAKGGKGGKTDKPAEKPVTEELKENPTDGGEGNEFADVTTIDGARAVLKAAGAKAGVLLDNDKMKAFASEKGIVFPNFVF